jgi:signal transduction histidine kinase
MTKAKASTSANSARTGLGLRETRERLRLLGGKLGMTSSAERGTTAEISLPERAESPAPAAV